MSRLLLLTSDGADELFFGRAAYQIWGGYDPPPFFVLFAPFSRRVRVIRAGEGMRRAAGRAMLWLYEQAAPGSLG